MDPDRRPTAQEIEELIDLVRSEPASPAFIDLGEAYLALGRPRDAIEIASRGLDAAPDSLEGRVMLARAFAALHQWKESQGELLRVVKVDRSSRAGFALLGEVLMRRNDVERALPVLQHAQALDPANPAILAMLRRARAGQPLDPPAPLPQPMAPRGETDNHFEIQRSRPKPPTAPPPGRRPVPGPQVPSGLPLAAPPSQPPAPPAYPPAIPPSGPRAAPPLPSRSMPVPAPPPDDPFAYADAAPPPAPPPPRMTKTSAAVAPQGQNIESVKPRLTGAKVANAAAASLRQSAAVGENYLNELLTGGLLDVAGVRVPEQNFDLRPDRRWGRSTRRAFIFLFVVLVLGIGGGGTWYWWSEKQNAAEVVRLQNAALVQIGNGEFKGLTDASKTLSEANAKDRRSLLTPAYGAEVVGLSALLYGTDPAPLAVALKNIDNRIKPGDAGDRELLIGIAAGNLAKLGTGDGDRAAIATASRSTLAETRTMLDAYLANHADEPWTRWLKARALLAAGERKAAKSQLEALVKQPTPFVLAEIDYADMLVDDGQLDDAVTLYGKALETSKDHPLAVLGRALGRAEASVTPDDVFGDLNTKFPDGNNWPRVQAYHDLALSLANSGTEDYSKAAETLKRAVAVGHLPNEPRFWARVAWAYYARGDLADAAKAAEKFAWFGPSKAEDDPTVKLVDAALLLASGLPDKALTVAQHLDGVRPRLLRARAYLDLGDAKNAQDEAKAAADAAPENVEARVLVQQAKLEAAMGGDRQDAADALDKLARNTKSQLGHHALGMAYHAVGDDKNAQPQLEAAIKGITDDAPNPLVYRTRTALAEILLAAGDLKGAGEQLDEALKANSGYFPTLALQAKVVLKNGEPDRALQMLRPILNEQTSPPPSVQLTLAEALATAQKLSPDDKKKAIDEATQILTSLKDKDSKDAPPAELSRVAALVDPALPKTLGLPDAGAAPAPTPKTPAPPKHHHR
ncbi:MAG TPA: tetratricopeptide repeat protein [Kofleriaceae bacterium]|jgi:tetratricopeptide (TPR) repeat protein